jgi:aryl-alcohol dehydrogenase-like predicted oxidoreductase
MRPSRAEIEEVHVRYKVFGRHTGLRVSELVLGTGTFGTRWGHGSAPDEARRILDAYAEAGGNFIDTADSYQFGEAEELLGRFLQGRRDAFVLATKFTQGATPDGGLLVTGNSRKAMVASLDASLRRLRTDRIDQSRLIKTPRKRPGSGVPPGLIATGLLLVRTRQAVGVGHWPNA